MAERSRSKLGAEMKCMKMKKTSLMGSSKVVNVTLLGWNEYRKVKHTAENGMNRFRLLFFFFSFFDMVCRFLR